MSSLRLVYSSSSDTIRPPSSLRDRQAIVDIGDLAEVGLLARKDDDRRRARCGRQRRSAASPPRPRVMPPSSIFGALKLRVGVVVGGADAKRHGDAAVGILLVVEVVDAEPADPRLGRGERRRDQFRPGSLRRADQALRHRLLGRDGGGRRGEENGAATRTDLDCIGLAPGWRTAQVSPRTVAAASPAQAGRHRPNALTRHWRAAHCFRLKDATGPSMKRVLLALSCRRRSCCARARLRLVEKGLPSGLRRLRRDDPHPRAVPLRRPQDLPLGRRHQGFSDTTRSRRSSTTPA